jgi:hypothetical protein
MRDADRLRLATASGLVVGPALFLVDNLIHPEELGRGNEALSSRRSPPTPTAGR